VAELAAGPPGCGGQTGAGGFGDGPIPDQARERNFSSSKEQGAKQTWKNVVMALLTLKDIQKGARAKGGECLSPTYLGSQVKHRWRCAQGHEWEARAGNVRRGDWCPECRGLKWSGGKPLTLKALKATARAKGGKCLSPALKTLKAKARAKGGECLSNAYLGNEAKHRWRCGQGHEWEACAGNVRRGNWCPECAGRGGARVQLTLADLQSDAGAQGGECLSGAYLGTSAKYLWRCAEGHEWEAPAASVRNGYWCRECVRKLKLEGLQATARARGGECVSVTYLGSRAKQRWRCAQGHEWEAVASSIRSGTWCPKCAGLERLKLDDLQLTARARGGECVSVTDLGSKAKQRWRCAEGHEWEACAGSVRQGTWCPFCGGKKLNLEYLQAEARARGGECLNDAYLGPKIKHRWRCAKGHEWETFAKNVHKGTWCPFCARNRAPKTNPRK